LSISTSSGLHRNVPYKAHNVIPHLLMPVAAVGILLLGLNISDPGLGASIPMIALCVAGLVASVISAVHHAEVIAHRLGEPFGTLVLALAVTIIEVALVLSIMIAGGPEGGRVPRDTVFAAVMIICNGAVGLCLLLGGLKHREQTFRIEGTGSGLAALAALSTLVLVIPSFTTSAPEGRYTTAQLIFVALASLSTWLIFVFVQTVRHRDYFLPEVKVSDETIHAPPPSRSAAWLSVVMMVLALVGVVGLAKLLSPTLDEIVSNAGAPRALVGVIIALVVLLPETTAALRAAHADRLQTSLNLAIGSAMASIGLTIPAVVVAAVVLDLPLEMGLETKNMALLALTFIVGAITLGSGRTNMMQGAVHVLIFAAFLFLTMVP
jgi:Ca2+:H+ antiporter